MKLVKGPHDVRFGSKADICNAKRHVRFTPESGHSRCKRPCPLDPRKRTPCSAEPIAASSWTVVQYECFSRRINLGYSSRRANSTAIAYWLNPSLPMKRGYAHDCSPIDDSFIAFARPDLASGVSSCTRRWCPCLLQGRRCKAV